MNEDTHTHAREGEGIGMRLYTHTRDGEGLGMRLHTHTCEGLGMRLHTHTLEMVKAWDEGTHTH